MNDEDINEMMKKLGRLEYSKELLAEVMKLNTNAGLVDILDVIKLIGDKD